MFDMDPIILATFALGLIILILLLTVLQKKKAKVETAPNELQQPGNRVVRRAAGVRNARRRMRNVENASAQEEQADEAGDENEPEDKPIEVPDGKIGAKKRAKLEAKAEKKALREAEDRSREERKKREQLLQEERDKQSERELAEELKQQEAEKKAREEKEKREYEEYLKMKEAFAVEEEGFEEGDEREQENLLRDFVEYVKEQKVVVLEDLAGHFGLKTSTVVERIQDLQEQGSLLGVIDDRGKFIYISQEELEAVAKFVRQRGRVSISELAEHSSRLINLNPGNVLEAR